MTRITIGRSDHLCNSIRSSAPCAFSNKFSDLELGEKFSVNSKQLLAFKIKRLKSAEESQMEINVVRDENNLSPE